jgi:multicomponent Na+:H+ antiporter subunit E
LSRLLLLIAALMTTWLLWSGVYEPLTIGLGAGSCVAVALLVRRLQHPDDVPVPVATWARLVLYTPWLLWEIVKANLDVAKIILSPSMPISPRLIRVDVKQRTPLGQSLYANSITLTPGTISLDLRDDKILVHALTQDTADGVLEGTMDRKCAWVENGTQEPS